MSAALSHSAAPLARLAPPPRPVAVAALSADAPRAADADDAELSDDALEHVVGGLARHWGVELDARLPHR